MGSRVVPLNRVWQAFARLPWWAWSVVLAAHLGITALLAAQHAFIPDEEAYCGLAVNVAKGEGFHLDGPSYWHTPGQPYTHFAPGWPAALAVGYRVAGEAGLWAVLGIVWCLNTWLVYRLGQRLGLPGGWCAALLLWLTANPFFLFYHGHLMTESLALTFCVALVLLGIQLLDRPSWRAAAGLAAVSALGHLVRSQIMLAAAAIWLVAAFELPWRRLVPLFLLFAVLHVAVIAPWLWRMDMVGAGFTSTELKLGINVFQFGGSSVKDPYDSSASVDWCYPPGIESMTPKARNAALLRAGLDGIAAHPNEYLRKCGQRVGYLLSPAPTFYSASWLQYWGMFAATLLFFYSCWAAILVRLALFRRLDRAEWLLLVAILVWYVFHFAINASIRNRLPSDPWCAALALSLWRPRSANPELKGDRLVSPSHALTPVEV
jgi:hypothetical protein